MAGKITIGAGLALDGEKEFKAAVSAVNKDLAVLGSEMGKVSAQFGSNAKSMEALTTKQDIYNRQIDEHKKKIEAIKTALANSAKEYGENDKKTKDWQISLNKAEGELAKTENSLKSTTDEIDKLGKKTDESGNKFEKFGGVLKGIGAALGAVAVAAGAAAAKLVKEVVAAYGDYEQLVGGVDTLFKESSQTVQTYAANAFKTAGLSANEYMETVTGFSASLIQSLDGDTTKAAKVADMAITDMADNANKMGTAISSIQNAYQGFAKQNYTMLDNLKLGYGGTKSEMERLLADAEKISGIEYDLSSFSDMTEAIHVIQTEMGITGTTALEATETITGSISGMQSAIKNLTAGLGNADADIRLLVGNVVEAFQNVVKNIVPVIENVVKALPAALDGIILAIGDLLPVLLSTVTELFAQVLMTILTLLPELIPAAVDAVITIAGALIDSLPLLIEAAVAIITALVMGISDALPQLIPAAVDAVITIAQGLVGALDLLIPAAINIIMALVKGIIDALPTLTGSVPQIIESIVETILNNLPLVVGAAIEIMVAIIGGLLQSIPMLVGEIPQIISSIIKAFTSVNWGDIGKNIISGIGSGIKGSVTGLVNSVKDAGKKVLDSAKNFFGIHSPSKLFEDEIGFNIGAGMAEGIKKSTSQIDKAMSQVNTHITADVRGYGGGYGTAVSNIYMDSVLVATGTGRAQYRRNAVRARALGVVPA